MDNVLLIVSMCQDGVVTGPKLSEFAKQCSNANWHHIMIPNVGDDEFLFLVNHIQSLIQRRIDDKKRIKELEAENLKLTEVVDHLQNWCN